LKTLAKITISISSIIASLFAIPALKLKRKFRMHGRSIETRNSMVALREAERAIELRYHLLIGEDLKLRSSKEIYEHSRALRAMASFVQSSCNRATLALCSSSIAAVVLLTLISSTTALALSAASKRES
jgi:prephenate dehydratase